MDPRLPELRALLTAREPVDERERAALLSFGEELERLAHPFDQESDPTHVTSSAIIVGASGVVLLRHKRLGIRVQPGGHVDGSEALAEAALREAREETGLALRHPDGGPQMVHVDAHDGGRGHTHLDVRWLLHGHGEPSPPEGESQEVAWFDWDSAIDTADPGLAGALRALRPRDA